MALRHTALFRWAPEVTENQIAELRSRLGELPDAIPELRSYSFGPDVGISAGNYDFAVVADIANENDFVAYRDHPAHQAVLALLGEMAVDRAAVRFEVQSPPPTSGQPG